MLNTNLIPKLLHRRGDSLGLSEMSFCERKRRTSRGWYVGGGYEPFTRSIHARAYDNRHSYLLGDGLCLSRPRVDWDSAKSLKSTRGCRSIVGADDKWGNGQLTESFPPFTRGAPRFASITEKRSVVSLVLIPGNYKLFMISRRDFAGSSGATRSPSVTRRRISRIFCDGERRGFFYLTRLP